MIKHGSQVFRHQGTVQSAQSIASTLIGKLPIVPKITDELVRQKLSFSQTEAGKMVNEDLKAFGAEMKDEIKVINSQLKDMTEQRVKDAKKAEEERVKLAEELHTALQEAAKKDEAKKELQALNKRLANERHERLKDMEDLQKDKERYEKLLQDAAQSQKQLREKLNARSNIFGFSGNNSIPPYPVRTILGFPRFIGFMFWAVETVLSTMHAIAMIAEVDKGGSMNPVLVLWCIFWICFSYLFFSMGPNALTIFIVVCVFIARLCFGMAGAGFNTGVAHERSRSEASAREHSNNLAITSKAHREQEQALERERRERKLAREREEQEVARERRNIERRNRRLGAWEHDLEQRENWLNRIRRRW